MLEGRVPKLVSEALGRSELLAHGFSFAAATPGRSSSPWAVASVAAPLHRRAQLVPRAGEPHPARHRVEPERPRCIGHRQLIVRDEQEQGLSGLRQRDRPRPRDCGSGGPQSGTPHRRVVRRARGPRLHPARPPAGPRLVTGFGSTQGIPRVRANRNGDPLQPREGGEGWVDRASCPRGTAGERIDAHGLQTLAGQRLDGLAPGLSESHGPDVRGYARRGRPSPRTALRLRRRRKARVAGCRASRSARRQAPASFWRSRSLTSWDARSASSGDRAGGAPAAS